MNFWLGLSSDAYGRKDQCGNGNLYCRHRIVCVVSGRMELMPSFPCARFPAAAAISLSSPVLRCCFRALLHFVRSDARPSQDIVSMSTAFISLTQTSFSSIAASEGGRWFCFPKPAHRRGCLLECDHPPYDVHTRAVRRANVEAAFPILLLISASKDRLSVMVEPR